MSDARLITLDEWLRRHFVPETAPPISTVRDWAKDGKLSPPAVKHGRRYYVAANARYTAGPEDDGIVGRLRADYASDAAPPVAH